MFEHYGIKLSEEDKKWFSGDGKELRGSILRGDKRGEAVVQLVSHEGGDVVGEDFYNGSKDSEVPCLKELLKATGICSQKVSLDALHFKPKTLELISKKGVFLVGLKMNQQEMYQEMEIIDKGMSANFTRKEQTKKHGRLENRDYESYDLSGAYFDKRWESVNFQSLIKVNRNRIVSITGKQSSEVSYFLSNMENKTMEQAHELFDAIRNHWQVEVNNNRRDCILKEDKLRCIYASTNQMTASCRTLVIKLLDKSEIENKAAQLDFFADNFDQCLLWLRKINFL